MTPPPDARAVDARLAEILGCPQNGYGHFIAPDGSEWTFEDGYFTKRPEGLSAMLEWAAGKGLEPEIGYSNFNEKGREWFGSVYGPGPTPYIAHGPSPGAALAAALIAHAERSPDAE